ncbi:MAG TPA: hypothetical protein VN860_01335, partial [Candidatus Acidoferrales bacterium]|nr:hypothetical protein [Candidatus Acidoferrales bacterium]
MNVKRRGKNFWQRLQNHTSAQTPTYEDIMADKETPAMLVMLAAIIPVLLWAAINAPHVSQTFACLLAAAALLEIVAPDSVRFGRRIVGAAFCIAVAGFV